MQGAPGQALPSPHGASSRSVHELARPAADSILRVRERLPPAQGFEQSLHASQAPYSHSEPSGLAAAGCQRAGESERMSAAAGLEAERGEALHRAAARRSPASRSADMREGLIRA
mmetsp:Transcript_75819/g.222303  ORF Transcript_75819/g.222303 Transcript_75819/m.222303 type:complete len:115 (+) Transcript_75819:222-566(+)